MSFVLHDSGLDLGLELNEAVVRLSCFGANSSSCTFCDDVSEESTSNVDELTDK